MSMSYVVCRRCGMAEHMTFACATGRTPTPQEALDLARRFGWLTMPDVARQSLVQPIGMEETKGVPAESRRNA